MYHLTKTPKMKKNINNNLISIAPYGRNFRGAGIAITLMWCTAE